MSARRGQAPVRVIASVRRALAAGRPVVALESSVLAQGLPAPHNADAARRMSDAVAAAGAVPAITAVAAGVPTVGLEPRELARFLKGEGVRKVAARDLGASVAQGVDGATTVAGALAIASLAGVRVLATGGIGGVHRSVLGASRDESADLLELARTPMIVVCSGAKAILDLPATWERLDTLGIPVVGVGTGEFPGFYTAHTGLPVTVRAGSARQAAEIAEAHFALGRAQAVLVVQPPPASVALEADAVERAVVAALAEAERAGARGAALTPALLASVARGTDGKSLRANLALLEANARLAGDVAVALRSSGPRRHKKR